MAISKNTLSRRLFLGYLPPALMVGTLIAAPAVASPAVPANPDAKLLELGRKFDAAVKAALKLDGKRRRLYEVSERVIAQRGISLRDIAGQQTVYEETGYRAAVRAFEKPHNEAVRLMRAIYRCKATTLAGVAVKLTAVTFDQFDFDVSTRRCQGADVAEKQLLRLTSDVRTLAFGPDALS